MPNIPCELFNTHPTDTFMRTRIRIRKAGTAMDSSQFKTLAQSLLKDSTLADFIITCGDDTYNIHRAIVACHSEYFKALFEGTYEACLSLSLCRTTSVPPSVSLTLVQESKKREIELKEDNPHAVKLMIDYFYGFDYEDSHDTITAFSNILELNAAVYVVADKYQVPDLKKLAVKHFAKAAPDSALRRESPKEAIKLAFTGTPATDRALRDLVLEYWMVFAKILTEDSATTSSIAQEVPEFAAEALNKTAETTSLRFYTECSASKYTTNKFVDVSRIPEMLTCTCYSCGKLTSNHRPLKIIREETALEPFWVTISDQ